jgi:hypothetical protein
MVRFMPAASAGAIGPAAATASERTMIAAPTSVQCLNMGYLPGRISSLDRQLAPSSERVSARDLD